MSSYARFFTTDLKDPAEVPIEALIWSHQFPCWGGRGMKRPCLFILSSLQDSDSSMPATVQTSRPIIFIACDSWRSLSESHVVRLSSSSQACTRQARKEYPTLAYSCMMLIDVVCLAYWNLLRKRKPNRARTHAAVSMAYPFSEVTTGVIHIYIYIIIYIHIIIYIYIFTCI